MTKDDKALWKRHSTATDDGVSSGVTTTTVVTETRPEENNGAMSGSSYVYV